MTGTPRSPAREQGYHQPGQQPEGALVREVPPAEEPAESVAKERQCVGDTDRKSAGIARQPVFFR